MAPGIDTRNSGALWQPHWPSTCVLADLTGQVSLPWGPAASSYVCPLEAAIPNCPGHHPPWWLSSSAPGGLGASQSGGTTPEDLLAMSADSRDRSLWGRG